MRNDAAFVATLAEALPTRSIGERVPLTRVDMDRAVVLARSVTLRGGDMMLTASEAMLVSRYLLHALGVSDKRAA